jgi:hypothetical protein
LIRRSCPNQGLFEGLNVKKGSSRFVGNSNAKAATFCVAISSASPMDTWTAEWIATRRMKKAVVMKF